MSKKETPPVETEEVALTEQDKLDAAATIVSATGMAKMVVDGALSTLDDPKLKEMLGSMMDDTLMAVKASVAAMVGVDVYNETVGPEAQTMLSDAFTRSKMAPAAHIVTPGEKKIVVTDAAEGVGNGTVQ